MSLAQMPLWTSSSRSRARVSSLNRKMGEGSSPKAPLVVEGGRENLKKDIDALDIQVQFSAQGYIANNKNLADLDVQRFPHKRVVYKTFSVEEQREIVFRDITSSEISHTTVSILSG